MVELAALYSRDGKRRITLAHSAPDAAQLTRNGQAIHRLGMSSGAGSGEAFDHDQWLAARIVLPDGLRTSSTIACHGFSGASRGARAAILGSG